jgi:hypothetical protein
LHRLTLFYRVALPRIRGSSSCRPDARIIDFSRGVVNRPNEFGESIVKNPLREAAGLNCAYFTGWWVAIFFDGTREQQEARLEELRADPIYQKPWAYNGPVACLEGGLRCDDIFLRLYEKEQFEKARSSDQKLLRSDLA